MYVYLCNSSTTVKLRVKHGCVTLKQLHNAFLKLRSNDDFDEPTKKLRDIFNIAWLDNCNKPDFLSIELSIPIELLAKNIPIKKWRPYWYMCYYGVCSTCGKKIYYRVRHYGKKPVKKLSCYVHVDVCDKCNTQT